MTIVALSLAAGLSAVVMSAPPTSVGAASVAPQFIGGASRRPEGRVDRIVTLAPSATEIVFALGAGRRVVGVSRFDDYPPSVTRLPRVGGFVDPNAESVAALKADLVIAVANAGNRPGLERIAKLGIPVQVVPGNTFEDIFVAIRAIAETLGGGAPAAAGRLEASMRQRVAALSRRVVAPARRRPRVAVVYGWQPLILAGPGSFADTLLAKLNATNVAEKGPQYPQYSVEQLLLAQPQVILDLSDVHQGGARPPWSRWTSVPAVARARVHRLRLGGLLHPGPRVVEGMRKMAELIHPQAFQ